MIEVGKSYIFKHCENIESEWNGKVVMVENGGFTIYSETLDAKDDYYNVISEDGIRGSALEAELIGEYN